jgi:NAD(P)-dependent dehydrogenase (short-subunit alcohol dehydrogenase family)
MKTVIVTGASRGIGAATAHHAARLGAQVVINARSEETLQNVASSIASTGVPVEMVAGDLRDERVCLEIITRAMGKFGRIDALVNNAGVLGPLARLDDVKLSEWEANWRLNVLVPMYLTSLALPLLRANRGRVVNISSGAAVNAHAGWAAYCSAKAALNAATKVLAAEESEVTVVAVRPGLVDTDMQSEVTERGSGVMDDGEYRHFVEVHERHDLASPDDVGRAVAVLALYAKPEWSGDFIALTEGRVTSLVASMRPKH